MLAFAGIFFANSGDTRPEILLKERFKYLNFSPPNSRGNDPFSKFKDKSSTSTYWNPFGIVPEKKFFLRETTVKSCKEGKVGGRFPAKALSERFRSLRFFSPPLNSGSPPVIALPDSDRTCSWGALNSEFGSVPFKKLPERSRVLRC